MLTHRCNVNLGMAAGAFHLWETTGEPHRVGDSHDWKFGPAGRRNAEQADEMFALRVFFVSLQQDGGFRSSMRLDHAACGGELRLAFFVPDSPDAGLLAP